MRNSFAIFFVTLASCAPAAMIDDGGSPADGATVLDARESRDSGPGNDSATTSDSATPMDDGGASSMDGATSSMDSGASSDASRADSGTSADASRADSGVGASDARADSGASSDAGTRSAGCGMARTPGFNCTTLMFGGVERRYCVEVRPGYDPNRAQSVVLGLHGCGGSPEGARRNTDPQVVEGSNEFLFVYPKAQGSCWTGSDNAFIQHVLTQVNASHCTIPGRVFADGMSSGAMKTGELLCSGTARAGAMIALGSAICRPTPVWIYGGTADEYWSMIVAARDAAIRVNRCSMTTVPLPSGPCVEYQGCTARTVWCTDSRGHVWPSEPWTSQIISVFRSTP